MEPNTNLKEATSRKRKCHGHGSVPPINAGKMPRQNSFLHVLCGATEEVPLPDNVQSAITFIQKHTVWSKMEASSIPPVVLRHQLYAVLSDRSLVDRDVNKLISECAIIQVQIDCDAYGLIDVKDFVNTVQQSMQGSAVADATRDKFVSAIRRGHVEVSMRRERLEQLCSLSDSDISALVRCGALATRDAHTLWLSVPNAYIFTRALKDGRRTIMDTIRRAKFKELLLQELLGKRFARGMPLGIPYSLLDLAGNEVLTYVETTSGPMLRPAG